MKQGRLSAREWHVVLAGALIVGLLLRLAFVGTRGFPTDVGTFQAWGERLRELGPTGFYAPGYFSDYPPGFLYVLWWLASLLGGIPAVVAKGLSIPFDLGIALAIYLVVRRVVDEGAGATAATLYLLNPALVLAGPYWGQVDAAGTLPAVLAVAAVGFGRFGIAGALGGLALLMKPQFGIALAAVLAIGALELLRARRPGPILRAAVAAAAVVLVLGVPFRFGPAEFAGLLGSAFETYPYTTLFAFNLWAVVLDFWRPDNAPVVLGLSPQRWGTGLFVIATLVSLAFLWWKWPRGRRFGADPARDVGLALALATLFALVFYFFPTRVHERYLFPALAFAAPFAALRARSLYAYLGLSTFFFLTVFYAFTRYPQTGTVAPALLEDTLFQRVGVILLTLAGYAVAVALAWWFTRGDAFVLAREGLPAPAPERTVRSPLLGGELPRALSPGGEPTRLDLKLALLLALLVLLTRGYRLDWPRDMYFDEVYHARTAMELLAGREPYEWTHPHLAKELMAMSITLFGGVRVVERGGAPARATVYVVSGDGSRAYARDGVVELVEPNGRTRSRGLLGAEPRALALRSNDIVALTERTVVAIPRDETPSNFRLPETTLPSEPRALALVGDRIAVATADEVLVFGVLGQDPERRIRVAHPVALQARPDGAALYVASEDGKVRLFGLQDGAIQREWDAGVRVASMVVVPDASRLFLGDAAAAVIHSIDLEGGGVEHVTLENDLTAPFRGPPRALAASPRTRLVWVLGQDGLVAVEPHGISAFAVVREAAGARALAIDDARDRVVAAAGIDAIEIGAGRVALAWRLPGVLASAILAASLFLLARRLFAPRRVALVLGALVLVDGAMFAQSRIGMNDIYVAAAIVAGWYLVASALGASGLRGRLLVLLAGATFGLGLAAKWAAGPPMLAVGVVSLVVTARAYLARRTGSGGPLDLLAGRGLNAVYLAFCFVVVPLAIYVASYLPWFALGHGFGPSGSGGWSFFELQRQMFLYHSQLTAPHAAGSPWWAWPLDLKPVYWEYKAVGGDAATYIYDAGNLVTWWAGIPAMAFVAYHAWRTRAPHLGLLLLMFATQYAQWIPVSRVLFQYHFFTALPFYLLALAAALVALWERERGAIAIAVVGGGVLWFLVYYPWLSALPVPFWLGGAYQWLPTWRYDCQFYPSIHGQCWF